MNVFCFGIYVRRVALEVLLLRHAVRVVSDNYTELGRCRIVLILINMLFFSDVLMRLALEMRC